MNKIVSTLCFLGLFATAAQAGLYEVTGPAVVRAEPKIASAATVNLAVGQVVAGEPAAEGWMKVSLSNGEGYVEAGRLKLKFGAVAPKTDPTHLPLRTIAIKGVPVLSAEKQTPSASPDCTLKNNQLEKELSDSKAEVKHLKQALSELKAEVMAMMQADTSGLVSAVDKDGVAVNFIGLGPAMTVTANGKTVIRFPVAVLSDADRLFRDAGGKRHIQDGFVYYIVDSKLVNF